MAAPRDRRLTVRFYELVAGADGNRAPEQDWLDLIKDKSEISRGFASPSGSMQGVARDQSGRLLLELAKQRETVPRQQEEQTHAIDDMTTKGDAWHPIEEAFALFFRWNVFALVRTGISAPSSNAVSGWLNAHANCPYGFWNAVPVVDKEKYHRLQEMGGLTFLGITSAPISSGTGSGSWFRDIFKMASGPPPDLALKIELTTTRGKSSQAEQEEIKAKAEKISEYIRAGDAPEILSAEVRGIPEHGGKLELFSLIEENVGVSQTVQLSLVGGAFTLRPEHTVNAMVNAFSEVEASVRSSLGVSPVD